MNFKRPHTISYLGRMVKSRINSGFLHESQTLFFMGFMDAETEFMGLMGFMERFPMNPK